MKTLPICKILGAEIAQIWPRARMRPLVNGEGRRHVKGFATRVAHERSLVLVKAQMNLKKVK